MSRLAGRAIALAAACGLATLSTDALAQTACADLLPQAVGPHARRPIAAADLVRLRDIGQPDSSNPLVPSPMALSPDGRAIAFVITRADPENNGYCRGLVVLSLEDRATRLVDRGGELIMETGVYRGLLVPGGFPSLVVPAWSPDGRWLAYLRRDEGVTRLWRAKADGSGAQAVSAGPADVVDFAWSGDGRALIYSLHDTPASARKDQEALSGYLYDARITPNLGPEPQPAAGTARQIRRIDLATMESTSADEADARLLPASGAFGVPAEPSAIAGSGRRAWLERDTPSVLAPSRLHAMDSQGRSFSCRADACLGGIFGLWWETSGASLLFLRREGWAKGDTALYRWIPGSANPTRLLTTSDTLLGCIARASVLLCTSDNASQPRRLVALDPNGSRSTVLFDPNPEFAQFRLGRVRRLAWRNDRGFEVRGDLVLPPGYRGAGRLPLVVVQYHSDGFLRGGTGDEVPVHVLAARGFAVLSLERPPVVASLDASLKSFEDINAVNDRDWAERKSLLSALQEGVDIAINQGIADPARIGVTGLCDGASTAVFALIHSRRFAAASIGICCTGPWPTMSLAGIAYADRMRRLGYPPASAEDRAFWQPVALELNAGTVDTPLLMQLADDEYLLALNGFTALREQQKPVEMHVFPAEHHIKWQPAHRLAIYQRNLDWFEFWLRGIEDPDPRKAEQYARWRALRALPGSSRSASILQVRAASQASTSARRMTR